MTYFLLCKQQKILLKNVGSYTVSVPIDFRCMERKSLGTNTVCYEHTLSYDQSTTLLEYHEPYIQITRIVFLGLILNLT